MAEYAEDDLVNEIDGEFYVVGSMGEREELLADQRVVIRQTDAALFTNINPNARTTAPIRAALVRFARLNYHYLCSIQGILAENVRATEEQIRKIVHLRTLALMKGLIKPADAPANHNCRYTDVILVADAETFPVEGNNLGVNDAIPNWAVDVNWRRLVKTRFTNIVCIVAYFMRCRGHHWLPDMDAKYDNLWQRCLYEDNGPGLPWRHVARAALHAVFPDDLDRFWLDSVQRQTCAGTLVKRIDVFPAGVAAAGGIFAGMQDLLTVFPAVRELLGPAVDEIVRTFNASRANRWDGSVNRRFYNGADLRLDEMVVAPLASLIVQTLVSSASDSPLLKSESVKRVANMSPITGAVMAQVIASATRDSRLVDTMFLEQGDDGNG